MDSARTQWALYKYAAVVLDMNVSGGTVGTLMSANEALQSADHSQHAETPMDPMSAFVTEAFKEAPESALMLTSVSLGHIIAVGRQYVRTQRVHINVSVGLVLLAMGSIAQVRLYMCHNN